MRILIVDSDQQAALATEQHCRRILGDRVEQVSASDTLSGAAAQLAGAAFDLVLLDPPFEESDGLGLFEGPTIRRFQTIIVSARTDLALRAFECGVVDFVPKPVAEERLGAALRRVAAAPKTLRPSERYLVVSIMGKSHLVSVDDLLYVEGADKYSELVLSNGQRSFCDKCLGRLEATLPRSFVRIHKSYLVRFTMVSRLRVLRGSRYFAELKNGLRLPVGRSRYGQLKSRII